MAIFKNFEEDELIIKCKCGCDEGVHFKIDKDESTNDYAFLTYTNGKFYSEQPRFISKLKKIWNIIKNKDYYYSDVIIDEDEFEQFKNWINKKSDEVKDYCMLDVVNLLDKLAESDPYSEIIVETTEHRTYSVKLSEANIYTDPYGTLVIDAE